MRRAITAALAMASLAAMGQQTSQPEGEQGIGYSITAISSASTGDFAPYYIGSLTHGKLQQKTTDAIDVAVMRSLDTGQRFSWGFGAEALSGYFSANDYDRYDAGAKMWTIREEGPAEGWLQQLYGEAKYRGVFLTVGMKGHSSALLNPMLSSGDLVESGNARPIPEVRAGFIDFQDIPFTNGWVQIQGEFSYGKMVDNNYLKHHYNYYSYHLNLGALYSYKRCYFRTNPRQPLSVTAGMQAGAFFGGETQYYSQGKLLADKTRRFSKGLKTFAKMLLPMGENGEDYYTGSTLGSWDLLVRYRFAGGAEVKVYFQWPWEDGSGIGRRNGWDGVWGVEYKAAKRGAVSGVVAEYIDFRNQSGPVHWSAADTPGTTITAEATGRDDYYNNIYYNSYANYGMAIGTPFLVSPVYNLDGYPAFACNRAQGVHLGVMGDIAEAVSYRLLLGWQRGLGTYLAPYAEARTCTSGMAEVCWDARKVLPGLSLRGEAAFDAGKLRGNNFGVLVSVTYTGSIITH